MSFFVDSCVDCGQRVANAEEEDDPEASDNVVSLKRCASSSNSFKETKICRTSSGHPKTTNYDDTVKALIILAISYYRANLSSIREFPDVTMEAVMLSEVCDRVDTTITITPYIAKLVKSCSLHFKLFIDHFFFGRS